MLVAAVVSFPALITFLLVARAAVAYAVAALYAGKPLATGDLALLDRRAWPRLAATYGLSCAAVIACLAGFLVLVVTVCSTLKLMLYPQDIVVCAGLITVLAFSVVYAHTIIVCNLGGVIAVLEDVSGINALRRSVELMRGQTHVGLLIFLGSTICLAFVEGLFEHRVKTLSYGDGSSRLWGGPLLVLMYSFVMLVDSMMSAVFYFTCRSSRLEILDEGGLVEELEMIVGGMQTRSGDEQDRHVSLLEICAVGIVKIDRWYVYDLLWFMVREAFCNHSGSSKLVQWRTQREGDLDEVY